MPDPKLAPELSATSAYLASLPAGLDSYPECRQKASVVLEFIAASPIAGVAERLPQPLADLITRPPLKSSWVPEVHAFAVYLAVADLHFPDESRYIAHWDKVNRALMQHPLYRALFLLASPKMVLHGADRRWQTLHQGITLTVDSPRAGEATITLRYPPALMPPLIAKGLATGFHVAIEGSSRNVGKVDLLSYGPTEARYAARWS